MPWYRLPFRAVSYLTSFFRYQELCDMQVNPLTSHMRNNLRKKVFYVIFTKQNHLKLIFNICLLPNANCKHAMLILRVFSKSLCVCDVKGWNLHIKQILISQEQNEIWNCSKYQSLSWQGCFQIKWFISSWIFHCSGSLKPNCFMDSKLLSS